MLISMIWSQGPSPDTPPRWITASAPDKASVIAAISVTDAMTTSSSGPGEAGGVMSSRRSVRPGRPRRSRSMDPIRPDPPVMTMIGTAVDLTRSPAADMAQDHPPRSGAGARPSRRHRDAADRHVVHDQVGYVRAELAAVDAAEACAEAAT